MILISAIHPGGKVREEMSRVEIPDTAQHVTNCLEGEKCCAHLTCMMKT